MISHTKIFNGFLYLMLLSPVLAYITVAQLGLRSITFYFSVVIIIYGFFLLFSEKRIKITTEGYFILFFVLYVFIWTFYNGDFERRGLVNIILYNRSLAILFIVLIIYNTSFKKTFIEKSALILKITVIISVVVSIIQVFNIDFLNAPSHLQETVLDIYRNRRRSIFGYIHFDALGLSFMPLLSVLLGHMLINKEKRHYIYLILGGLVAILSNGRYIMIGFLIITFQVLVFNKLKINSIFKYSLLVIFAGFVLYYILTYVGYNIQEWHEARLFAEGDITETTRYKAIDNFLYFFPQYALFGDGGLASEEIATASRAVGSSHIHVGYLSHLVRHGIVGCFFLFGFWFLLLKRLYKTAKLTNYWGSFFAFLMFLWSFATMSQPSIFFYGLIFAMVFDKYFRDKYNEERKAKQQENLLRVRSNYSVDTHTTN